MIGIKSARSDLRGMSFRREGLKTCRGHVREQALVDVMVGNGGELVGIVRNVREWVGRVGNG